MPKQINQKTISKIREEYAGKEKIKVICKKHKISFNTLKKYIKQEDEVMRNNDIIAIHGNKINQTLQTSTLTLQELEKAERDITLIKQKVEKNLEKTNESINFLEQLKTRLEQNILRSEDERQKLLTKSTISKTVIIDTTVKGIKKITETRALDGHETASIIKVGFDQYKTLYHQTQQETPAVVINNNNQQMQVNENIKTDLQTLNDKLVEANIDNFTDEN